jgi:hypothetical protein
MVAELFEKKGRFIDLITDMVWLFCESTSWIVPAHNWLGGYTHIRHPLPEKDNQIIDLMASEVGAAVAFACHLFKDEFDAVSPQIYTRAVKELYKRIINPYRDRTDYWWMGFMKDYRERLNNWNPWINTNVLIVLLLTEHNSAHRYYTLHKIAESLDKYYESYPQDGGCDEGPGYWGRAGASFFESLEILYDFTDGRIDFYGEEKLRNMCSYIYKTHIAGPYFVNFADAGPVPKVDYPLIYRFGKAVGDTKAMDFSSYLYGNDARNSLDGNSWIGMLKHLGKAGVINEIAGHKGEYASLESLYFDDIEVACFRTSREDKQLFIAAKGGNNFENHNHNDVGNFIIYGGGEPFIIDAGFLVYEAKTFSPQRYTIWNNRSDWHNVPDINGQRQKNGREYKAKDSRFEESGNICRLSMDIKDAYPEDAGVKSWERTFTVNKDEELIEITDSFEIGEPGSFLIHLITLPRPEISDGSIRLEKDGKTVIIEYDSSLSASYEKLDSEDTSMIANWGGTIYRITLENKSKLHKGKFKLGIRME